MKDTSDAARREAQLNAIDRIASRNFDIDEPEIEREKLAKRLWERREQFSAREPYSWEYLIQRAAEGSGDYADILTSYLTDAKYILDGAYPPITTYEALEQLPVGSIVIGAGGWWAFQSDYLGAGIEGEPRPIEWGSGANWFKTQQIELPAHLLHIPLGSD